MNKVLPLVALVISAVCVVILFSPLLRQLLSHISIVTANPTMLVVVVIGGLIFGLWRLSR